MALNPEISLGVRPPVIQPLQIQSPLEQFAKVQSLRNLMQEQQSGQLGLQAQQLKLQEAQKGIADEQSLRDLLIKNPNAGAAEVIGAGGPVRGIAWLKSRQEAEKARLDRITQVNTLNVANAKRRAQIAAGVTDLEGAKKAAWQAANEQLYDLDPARNAQIARDTLEHLQKNGFNPDEWKQHAMESLDYAARTELENKVAEEARKKAAAPFELRAATAKATTAEQEAAGTQPITPQQAAEAARQSIPNTPTELAIWMNDPKRTPEERVAGQAAFRDLERHAVASRPVVNNMLPGLPTVGAGGQNQTTGEEFIKTLTPGFAAEIRGMAEGRLTAPSANSRAPGAAQKREALLRFDPAFSEQRAQIRKSFLTGPDSGNLGKVNTAIVHLGRLGNAAESLNNGSFVPGNEAYNWLRDKFGSDKVTNFGLLKDAVASEMAAALKGNATDIEIEKMGRSIRAANSPEQMRGVIQEGMSILNDKANTYDERYHQLLPDDPWSPILPSAKAQLARHLPGGAGGGKKAPPVGAVVDGHKFKGGDPNKQENWEEVKR